jgi:transcription antitermination factor NusA-like protein
MVNTIDMQDMRYLNLFGKITRVNTRFCFKYNGALIYCVPKSLIQKAVGENGKNIKQIGKILGTRIKIIPKPRGVQDLEDFMKLIISPVNFRDMEIRDKEVIVNAGAQNKAALIGRNKRRFFEMQKIIRNFFGREFRII